MDYISAQVGDAHVLLMWLPDDEVVVRLLPETLALLREMPLRDWSGAEVKPEEGERFLEAAFDRFTLHGMSLQWVSVERCGLAPFDFLDFPLAQHPL